MTQSHKCGGHPKAQSHGLMLEASTLWLKDEVDHWQDFPSYLQKWGMS
jgi:hypothetical protein